MQIQMRLYEDDVNTTIIEETDRRKNIDPLQISDILANAGFICNIQ